MIEITHAIARKVLNTVDAGLVSGPSAGPVDIAWIFENDLEQKLSVSVRCF